MGGGASTGAIDGIRSEWLDVFRAMKLNNGEIKKLSSIYNSVDADRSGSIEVVELLTLLDIERTPFNERIFSAFDKDRTGHIDLYEFVVSLWKFCTLGNGAISVFAFDIYDSDADGLLTSDQVKKMFRELSGAKGMEHETAKAGLADLLRMGTDGMVSINDFRPYCKTHQALLTPVFTIQTKLRDATLGGGTWTSLSNRSIEVHPGRSMPIKDLMILHSDRKMFHSLLEDSTILRVSSMMRIVLDNTDNAQHCVSPLPAVKQRNTYIIAPQVPQHGNVDNQNGDLRSVNNTKLNTHTPASAHASAGHVHVHTGETSGRSVSVHSAHSTHSTHSVHNAAVLNAHKHQHQHHAVHDPHVLDVTHEHHSNTSGAHNSGASSMHNSGEHSHIATHTNSHNNSHNNSHGTMDHHLHHHHHKHEHDHKHEHEHGHAHHAHPPETSVHSVHSVHNVHSVKGVSAHTSANNSSMHSIKHNHNASLHSVKTTHTSPTASSTKHSTHTAHSTGSAGVSSPQHHQHGHRSAARSTAPVAV